MFGTSDDQMRAAQEYIQDQERIRLGLVRKIVNFVGVWQVCENRACRRGRGCADPHACGERYKEEILRFERETIVPWLREQYPTVQWGAPASVVEAQFEAACAAEEEEKARREGRADASGSGESGARRRKKRVARHPLYDPGDA